MIGLILPIIAADGEIHEPGVTGITRERSGRPVRGQLTVKHRIYGRVKGIVFDNASEFPLVRQTPVRIISKIEILAVLKGILPGKSIIIIHILIPVNVCRGLHPHKTCPLVCCRAVSIINIRPYGPSRACS